MAVAPASAIAAVFGIARTTRVPGGRRASIASIGTPAAIDTTTSVGERPAPIGARMRSTICGFTATTITSAQRATASLSSLASTPNLSWSSATRSGFTSVARICSFVTVLEWRRPRMRAAAMLPPPMKPMRRPRIGSCWSSFMRRAVCPTSLERARLHAKPASGVAPPGVSTRYSLAELFTPMKFVCDSTKSSSRL